MLNTHLKRHTFSVKEKNFIHLKNCFCRLFRRFWLKSSSLKDQPYSFRIFAHSQHGRIVTYPNSIAIESNCGWRYDYGNMFYVKLIHQALDNNPSL